MRDIPRGFWVRTANRLISEGPGNMIVPDGHAFFRACCLRIPEILEIHIVLVGYS